MNLCYTNSRSRQGDGQVKIADALPEGSELKTIHRTSRTYELVGVMNYLLGVPEGYIQNSGIPRLMERFQELNTQKRPRIIRILSIVRTAVIRHYNEVNALMREGKTLRSYNDESVKEATAQLSKDRISFIKKTCAFPSDYIIEINKLMLNHINNCQNLFPSWINWDYVKDLFIMPDGLSQQGTKIAYAQYKDNIMRYPFQMYCNWTPTSAGNILASDEKFATLLYEWHEDCFTDLSKVSDVDESVLDKVYEFFSEANKLTVIVDCENADPFKLYTALTSLNENEAKSIQQLILVDSNPSLVWDEFEKRIDIPIEKVLCARLKESKSLVDMRLAMRVSRAYYEEQIDSFVLVSSDSDYWAMLESLPNVKFLVMIESAKCSSVLKTKLSMNNVFYCHMDDFYSGGNDTFKQSVLLKEINARCNSALHLNLKAVLDASLRTLYTDMGTEEYQKFYDECIKHLTFTVQQDGTLQLEVKSF
jgi:uncharacterized LabA/DUF88 family protein